VLPGHVIATAIADGLQNWVSTLAMMHCGAVPCLMSVGGGLQDLTPDFVMSPADDAETAAVANVRRLAPPVGRSEGRGLHPPTIADAGDLAQIILSSGTTGPAKAVPLTWATLAQRTALRDRYFPIDGPVLSLMQPATAGGLQTCLTALTHGLMVDISTNLTHLVGAASDPTLRYIIGSPGQLASLIKAMDVAGVQAPHIVGCLVMGGAVSQQLQDAAARVFAVSVMALYGSTELGACAVYSSSDSAAGMTLLADVQAQAVSDAGLVLPDGQDGTLRFKAPGMADSYHLSAVLSAMSFQNGWFYPGDTGSVSAGKIMLTGRRDELINLGGAKVNPADIDQHIETLGLTADAAAFKFVDAQGVEMLIIAVVAGDDAAYGKLKTVIRAELRQLQCPVGFFRVSGIARNAMGKPQRTVLADQMQQAIGRQATKLHPVMGAS
jgi:acyl-CoA synthetase (AMP-forming)/AMP-acid ligase II